MRGLKAKRSQGREVSRQRELLSSRDESNSHQTPGR